LNAPVLIKDSDFGDRPLAPSRKSRVGASDRLSGRALSSAVEPHTAGSVVQQSLLLPTCGRDRHGAPPGRPRFRFYAFD
jgi:hypothetical protein